VSTQLNRPIESSISVHSESVETSVVDVSVVRQNIEFDVFEDFVGDGRFEHLDRFSAVVVREAAEEDRVGVVIGGFEAVNDEIFGRRVDVSRRGHRLGDVLHRKSGRTHRGRKLDD
jgi:hypothetical protein